jgi:23S rRNA maturation-related 3'-5' exoribonuclease YhaM
MNKEEMLTTEINFIKDLKIREDLKFLLRKVPDYFYEIPASSTGKYHPDFTLGEQGLIRHTKAATRIGKEILSLDCYKRLFTERDKDLLIFAIIIHDTFKCGKTHEKYTRFDHPLLVRDFIEENKEELSFNSNDLGIIELAVSSHMGQWNTNPYSDIVLPRPQTRYQMFVHTCDYLASRKFLNINFENNEII